MQIENLLDVSGAIEAIASLLSVIVAVVALVISRRVEKESIRREQEFAAASVKPFLAIHTHDYENLRAVILVNHGSGLAVITRISFSKNGDPPVDNIVKLMYRDKEVMWDTYSFFTQGFEYLRAEDKIYLAKLSEENLIEAGGLSNAQARKLLDEWNKQISGVKVHINYQDILGNKQPDCERLFV